MGERPQKPDHFEIPGLTLEVWEIAEMCWDKEPKERPDAHTILQYISNLMGSGMFTSTPLAIHPHHFHPIYTYRGHLGVDLARVNPQF